MQSAFEVGAPQRDWLRKDLAKVPTSTPLIVFSHSPLYKLYRPWNFWTDDAEDVQSLLQRFDHVTVLHGHTHQVPTNRNTGSIWCPTACFPPHGRGPTPRRVALGPDRTDESTESLRLE